MMTPQLTKIRRQLTHAATLSHADLASLATRLLTELDHSHAELQQLHDHTHGLAGALHAARQARAASTYAGAPVVLLRLPDERDTEPARTPPAAAGSTAPGSCPPDSDTLPGLRHAGRRLTDATQATDAFYRPTETTTVTEAGRRDQARLAIRHLTQALVWLATARGQLTRDLNDADNRVAATDVAVCDLGWGVCPTCGDHLTQRAGRTRCRRCGRTWLGDRIGQHCHEPVAYLITADAATGATVRMCHGHWLWAHDQSPRVRIATDLTTSPPHHANGDPA